MILLYFFFDTDYSAGDSPEQAYATYGESLAGVGIRIEDLTFPLLWRRGKAPVTFCVEENNGGLYWENFVYREGRVDDNMGLSVKDNFYGVDSIPATFIVDKTGIIRDSHVGRLELRELEEKIQPYL